VTWTEAALRSLLGGQRATAPEAEVGLSRISGPLLSQHLMNERAGTDTMWPGANSRQEGRRAGWASLCPTSTTSLAKAPSFLSTVCPDPFPGSHSYNQALHFPLLATPQHELRNQKKKKKVPCVSLKKVSWTPRRAEEQVEAGGQKHSEGGLGVGGTVR
jgi:hypothetical protein